jgi:hypothetical protein
VARVLANNTRFSFAAETAVQMNLFRNGRDKFGRKIKTDRGNPYMPYTVSVKKRTRLPHGHVTLYQTGGFYRTFDVRTNSSRIEIKHDGYGYIYENFKRYAPTEKAFFEAVLGLSRPTALDLFRTTKYGYNFQTDFKNTIKNDVVRLTH